MIVIFISFLFGTIRIVSWLWVYGTVGLYFLVGKYILSFLGIPFSLLGITKIFLKFFYFFLIKMPLPIIKNNLQGILYIVGKLLGVITESNYDIRYDFDLMRSSQEEHLWSAVQHLKGVSEFKFMTLPYLSKIAQAFLEGL